jgi:hypothetical protein
VVQFEKAIRIRARLSGVPQPVETPTGFSGCGGKPAAEADSLASALAASLQRSPDTDLFLNCTTTKKAASITGGCFKLILNLKTSY